MDLVMLLLASAGIDAKSPVSLTEDISLIEPVASDDYDNISYMVKFPIYLTQAYLLFASSFQWHFQSVLA